MRLEVAASVGQWRERPNPVIGLDRSKTATQPTQTISGPFGDLLRRCYASGECLSIPASSSLQQAPQIFGRLQTKSHRLQCPLPAPPSAPILSSHPAPTWHSTLPPGGIYSGDAAVRAAPDGCEWCTDLRWQLAVWPAAHRLPIAPCHLQSTSGRPAGRWRGMAALLAWSSTGAAAALAAAAAAAASGTAGRAGAAMACVAPGAAAAAAAAV